MAAAQAIKPLIKLISAKLMISREAMVVTTRLPYSTTPPLHLANPRNAGSNKVRGRKSMSESMDMGNSFGQ